MPEVRLEGCTPEPLMSYLKALGVFRLVAEQADPAATLSWRGGSVCLSSKFDRNGLTTFFLNEYRPTPIIAPWGARSGFYAGSSESTARQALDVITATHTPRFELYRNTIAIVRNILTRLGIQSKNDLETGNNYIRLLQLLRNELPEAGPHDGSLAWFETVCVNTLDNRRFPPLLGTGGNEGSGSYVSTFAQMVVSLLVRRTLDAGVGAALFDDFGIQLGGLAVGHFDPGALGGPNGSQGFSGGGGANPWEYLLGIEGTLQFAGAASRRLGSDTAGRAGYPFCVDPVAVGYATESDKEAGDATRAEMWLPLWDQPCTLPELAKLFSEGRAQLGRRQARNAVEFALALACLGVSRGITSFVRYAFVMRYGLSYFAAPLGHLAVTPRLAARLLDDPPLTQWIERLRRACSDKEKTPARYQSALRQIDRTMFAFVNRSEQGNDAKYLLEVLSALGRAERTMATEGLSWLKDKQYGWKLNPLKGLSSQWLDQANDRSREFRLAVALAGVDSDKDNKVGPLRVFLEPVEVTQFVNWSPGSTSAVWSKRPLALNLATVFRRRQMEAFRAGLEGVPLYSARPAQLADVIAFLNEETDDDRLHDLLWGLIAVDIPSTFIPPATEDVDIPFEFGVARLLVQKQGFVPNGKRWKRSNDIEPNAQPDPDVFHTLAFGRPSAVGACVDRAARRLKSGGLLVTGYRNRRQAGKSLGVVSAIRPERLLAAMLFPLSHHDLERIANAVLYPPESEE
jgi:CRISPR-associated protein Csx17